MKKKEREERHAYARTHTLQEFADKFGMSYKNASWWCSVHGIETVRAVNDKYSILEKERLEYARTHTVKECAKHWNCSEENVRNWLWVHGGKAKGTRSGKAVTRSGKAKGILYPEKVVKEKVVKEKPVIPESTYEKMALIPVYPDGIRPKWIGLNATYLPRDAVICEEARLISWVSQEYKDAWLKKHKEEAPR